MLRLNPRVQDLRYEPEPHRPDFRLLIGGVTFDTEVKCLRQVKNEEAEGRLFAECNRRFADIPKPRYIEVIADEAFEVKHIDPFCRYIESNIDAFSRSITWAALGGQPYYEWPPTGSPLATFVCHEKESAECGITVETMRSLSPEDSRVRKVGTDRVRYVVKKKLIDARRRFGCDSSPMLSNMVIL